MRKVYSKNELIAVAKDYFKNYPSIDKFYVTNDSMFFTQENKADGSAHAKNIDSDLIEIERGDEAEEEVSSNGDGLTQQPSDKWNKTQLAEYMTAKGISFDESDTKAVLLQKIADFVPAA